MAKSLLPASFPNWELGLGPTHSQIGRIDLPWNISQQSGRSESIPGPTLSRSTRSWGVNQA